MAAVATVQLRNGPERLQWLQYNSGIVQRGCSGYITTWERSKKAAVATVQLRNGPERLQWLQYNLGMVQRGCSGYSTT